LRAITNPIWRGLFINRILDVFIKYGKQITFYLNVINSPIHILLATFGTANVNFAGTWLPHSSISFDFLPVMGYDCPPIKTQLKCEHKLYYCE
jgi:hypothetical protein